MKANEIALVFSDSRSHDVSSQTSRAQPPNSAAQRLVHRVPGHALIVGRAVQRFAQLVLLRCRRDPAGELRDGGQKGGDLGNSVHPATHVARRDRGVMRAGETFISERYLMGIGISDDVQGMVDVGLTKATTSADSRKRTRNKAMNNHGRYRTTLMEACLLPTPFMWLSPNCSVL